MALCEIINKPEDYTTNSDDILVVPEEGYITTRYFLVNPSGHAHSKSLQITLPNTLRLAKRALNENVDEPPHRKKSK